MTSKQGNEDLIADYLGEAHDYLEQLNKLLLALSEADGAWPKDQVNELFRSAHSLKGLSACFGYERTNTVTHELETLMSSVRDGKIAPSAPITRVMFDAIDVVSHLTAEIASSGRETAPIDLVLADLKRTVADAASGKHSAASESPGKAKPDGVSPAAASGGDTNETVRVRMERLDRMVNLTGELVVARSRFQLVAHQLRALQRVGELGTVCQDVLHGITAMGEVIARGQTADAAKLLERLHETGHRLQVGLQDVAGVGRLLRDLDDVAYDFDGVVGGIHEAVLQLRMVPLDSVFRRLQRAVRDTAEVVHKQVDLHVTGGETQIDKRVADELVNPLVHMLRNSVDHGLETADKRRQNGKPARGRIDVTSYQRGSSVVIEVTDDGAGIDPARVLAKAVEQGLVTAEEASVMPPREAQRLIFAPGFSTAKQITEVSGRGMGMDIIAASIKKLRGSLEMQSEVGKGTTFTVQLPPSMSILTSLLLEVRGIMFAMPLTEVREIVELARVSVQFVQSRRMIVVRERPMPLVLLPDTYRFQNAASDSDGVGEHAIVFGFAGNEVALGVDRLVGKEDLVIKPLCPELSAVRGLAGMAIRGDGKVTLILDPSGFAEFALARHQAPILPALQG